MPTHSQDPKAAADRVVAKLRRTYAGGSVRESELEFIAGDLGYRRADPQRSSVEWLASKLATAGHHPSMPRSLSAPDGERLSFRNGDLVPTQSGASYVVATVNRLLAADVAPCAKCQGTGWTMTPSVAVLDVRECDEPEACGCAAGRRAARGDRQRYLYRNHAQNDLRQQPNGNARSTQRSADV